MEKAKITFLGTGGGRFVMINQLRATGGWILEMDGEVLHIDPGPGALVKARQYRVRLKNLTGVLVSHCHPDHYSDAEVVISSMTDGETKKRGSLITSRSVSEGGNGFNQAISDYFQGAVKSHTTLLPGEKARIGNIEIEATRTDHGDPEGIGFIFRGSLTIGYASDTGYFEGLEGQFKGCDYMVLNVLRPRNVGWPKHMNSKGAVKVLKAVKPKGAVCQQFGILMVRAGPEKEAGWIEKESGIKTIAARDGMVLELSGKGMKRLQR